MKSGADVVVGVGVGCTVVGVGVGVRKRAGFCAATGWARANARVSERAAKRAAYLSFIADLLEHNLPDVYGGRLRYRAGRGARDWPVAYRIRNSAAYP
jgi:hypothetical protein